MASKINLLFDTGIFQYGFEKNSSRSGIYFVAYNILKTLLEKNEFKIILYFQDSNKLDKLKEYLDVYFNKYKHLEILSGKSDLSVEGGNIDAFFSPIYKAPDIIRKNPQISIYFILYDTIPLAIPYYFEMGKTWFFDLFKSLRKTDYYFPISNFVNNSFIESTKEVNQENSTTIMLAANDNFYPNKNINTFNKTIEKYAIPSNKNYLMSLFTLEPRKNAIMAIKSFIKFIDKNNITDLVYILVGCVWDDFYNQIALEVKNFANYSDKIIFTGYVDDEDLCTLYSNALFFIFTSKYEGFGLPVLEAMKCGVPVITSNSASLPEIVSDAGIMIDFYSEEQHIEAYEKYYYNEELRKIYSKKGIERASFFTWDKCVDIISKKITMVEEKKKNTPKISIVTVVYNLIKSEREDCFKRCIESIQNQTYKNIEHIIIDGNSTDGTIELIKEYEKSGILKWLYRT